MLTRSQVAGKRATARPAAVAGVFYPASASELSAAVRGYVEAGVERLAETGPTQEEDAWPKAVIAPHAGYRFSGPVAGTAYAALRAARGRVSRVVLYGPSHHFAFEGIGVSGASAFETPLGDVTVDAEAVERLLGDSGVSVQEAAHAPEHGLEVHLPFLWETLGPAASDRDGAGWRIVPLLFGQADDGQSVEVLAELWGGRETLFVISSDLSHYLDPATAERVDRETAAWIEAGEAERIAASRACGHAAVAAMLRAAAANGLRARCVDLRHSGKTAGPMERVVGYGAFVFE